jgi:hypothetical protein
MDVHCSTCNEPWDTYHLKQDEIYETDLTPEEAEAWTELSPSLQLQPRYREKFKALGWEFGNSVLNVIRCPACPKDAQADPERLEAKSILEELLGDDADGLAATFEDYGF